MVREVDLTIDDLEEAAIGWAEAGGWAKLITENPEPDDGPEPVRAFARDLVQDSADFAGDYANVRFYTQIPVQGGGAVST